jgi:hypothetical protein
MRQLTVLVLGLLVCGCAGKPEAAAPAAAESVRQQFVPAASAPASPPGASFSRLEPVADEPGALWAQAWAGVGEKFPVQDHDGKTLFEVLVTDGGDERLAVTIHSQDGGQKVVLQRDNGVSIQAAGATYELLYTSVYVGPGSAAASNKAHLIVMTGP